MLGRKLTALGAIAVLGIGAGAWLWPRRSTRTYGILKDDDDSLAYVRATAARDLSMGAFVLWAACAGDRRAMEAGLAACVLAPLADFVVVRGAKGNVPQLLIHASGVAGIVATLALVRANL
jgi:hypothetical protein